MCSSRIESLDREFTVREYVELREKGIDLQIAEDMAAVLVDEQGHPDNLKTLGLAVLQLAMVRLKVRTNTMMRPPELTEQDQVYRKTGMIPKPLSFWIHTLVGAVGRERHLADMNTLWDRRLLDGLNLTGLDS